MTKARYDKSFIFSLPYGELQPLLNLIISDIYLENSRLKAQIDCKCRIILTELLSNAEKHSQINVVQINVQIDELQIEISKIDYGRPFYLSRWKERQELNWPVNNSYEGNSVVIYEDQICCLYGFIKNKNEVIFYSHDLQIEIPQKPKDILEHFGLMILTKASDCFTYVYDPVTQVNTFRVKIFYDSHQRVTF